MVSDFNGTLLVMSGCHQHLVFLPRRSAGNTPHGIVRFGHSLQSTNTKRIHPQPHLTACQDHRTGLGAHLNAPLSRVTFNQAAEGLVLDYLPEQRSPGFSGQPAGLQLPPSASSDQKSLCLHSFSLSPPAALCPHPCLSSNRWSRMKQTQHIQYITCSMALHTSHHPVCISQFSFRDTSETAPKAWLKAKQTKSTSLLSTTGPTISSQKATGAVGHSLPLANPR